MFFDGDTTYVIGLIKNIIIIIGYYKKLII